MEKLGKKLLVGAAVTTAGAAAFGAVNNFITGKLVSLAMNRNLPESVRKNSEKALAGEKLVFKTMPEVLSGKEYLENLGCETVEITSCDGLKLKGHWYAGENPDHAGFQGIYRPYHIAFQHPDHWSFGWNPVCGFQTGSRYF